MSDMIERVEAARRFPTNTCGASRHAAQIGEALMRGEPYPMLTEEPDHCGESILATVAALWEARTEIERLTAERDELRRQFDPMGEYASADELIAALHAEKAEDEAMKLDARRYRWLRDDGSGFEITVCEEDEDGHETWVSGYPPNELDIAIDAAMGLTRPAEE